MHFFKHTGSKNGELIKIERVPRVAKSYILRAYPPDRLQVLFPPEEDQYPEVIYLCDRRYQVTRYKKHRSDSKPEELSSNILVYDGEVLLGVNGSLLIHGIYDSGTERERVELGYVPPPSYRHPLYVSS